jgi:hypothetical protein
MFLHDNEDSTNNLEAAVEAAVVEAESEMLMIHEGEEAVVPSVCSISMAAISSAMSHAGMDHMVHEQTQDGPHMERQNSFADPNTFGSHMRTPSMEGLDLALGGIEF